MWCSSSSFQRVDHSTQPLDVFVPFCYLPIGALQLGAEVLDLGIHPGSDGFLPRSLGVHSPCQLLHLCGEAGDLGAVFPAFIFQAQNPHGPVTHYSPP